MTTGQKEYTWTMNCVEVVSSWPPKNPLATTYCWVQELEADTAVAIRTSKCTAKIVPFMMLNSIIMVCLDRWWCKSAQLLCSSKMMLHWKAWTLLRWLRNQRSGKEADTPVIAILWLQIIFLGVCCKSHCFAPILLSISCSIFHILTTASSVDGLVRDPTLLSKTRICFSLGRTTKETNACSGQGFREPKEAFPFNDSCTESCLNPFQIPLTGFTQSWKVLLEFTSFLNMVVRGLFLESPGNLTGPESYF